MSDKVKPHHLARKAILSAATITMAARIASPEDVPETSSVASPSVLPLPHDPPAEPQLFSDY